MSAANKTVFLKKAKIIPFSVDCKLTYDEYIHGVYHECLSSDARGLVRGKDKKLLINERRRRDYLNNEEFKATLKGVSLYAGPFYNHFGNFISQTVTRLWAYKAYAEEIDQIVFLGRTKNDKLSKLKKYMVSILNILEIPLEKIVFITDPVVAETLVLPMQGYGIGFKESWYKNYFDKSFSIPNIDKSVRYEKVFLSRRGFRTKGRLAGMDAVANVLKENGYVEVFPENLSLEEQVNIVFNAEYIVAEEGSALHILDVMPSIKANFYLIGRRENYTGFEELIWSCVLGKVCSFYDVHTIDVGLNEANSMSISFNLLGLIRDLYSNKFIDNDILSLVDIDSCIVKDLVLNFKGT